MAQYDPRAIEEKWQKVWDEQNAFLADADPSRPKYLHARDAAVSLGHHAHGPHAQLHHRGCRRAISLDARIQCAPPDGLGRFRFACGKRRDQRGIDPREWTRQNIAEFKRVMKPVRIQLRLAQGNFHLRAGILSLESVVFSAHAGARHRLPKKEPRELVPEMPDGAGERAGG